MLKIYVKEQRPWMILFFIGLLLMNIVILLDTGLQIKPQSLVYLNILLVGLFLLFLCGYYMYKKTFLKELHHVQRYGDTDLHPLEAHTHSPLEHEVLQALTHLQQQHQKRLSEQAGIVAERDQIMTSWVHEAKSPLTAMKLIIDQGRKENIAPAFLKELEDEWLKLDSITEKQLYSIRLAHFENDYFLQEVTLSKCVHPVLSYYSKWFIEKNISVQLEGLDLLVRTDVIWLRFVLKQLIDNALKYSSDHTEIQIIAKETAKGIALHIKDAGQGIAKEHLPKIFSQGYTGEAGRVTANATGMGLFLAKKVTTKLGHQLNIASKKNSGTTVTIIFLKQNKIDKLTKM